MTINIPDNLTPQAQALLRRLLDTRRQEVEVLSGLSDEQMFGSPMKEVEPPIWEMGHVDCEKWAHSVEVAPFRRPSPTTFPF